MLDSMRAPVWLLDVDGPLNASRPGWRGSPRQAWARDRAGTQHHIRWEPKVIRAIRQLRAEGWVDPWWCSSWCPYADVLERVLGLPALPRALVDDPVPTDSAGDALKLRVAQAVLITGRRLIWTDDTAIPADGAALDELTTGGRVLLIRPDPRRGLRPEHLVRIREFLGAPATDD